MSLVPQFLLLFSLSHLNNASSITLPREGTVPYSKWANEIWDSTFELILDTSGCHKLKRELVFGDWDLIAGPNKTDVQFHELRADEYECRVKNKDNADELILKNIQQNAAAGLSEVGLLLAPTPDESDDHDELRHLLMLAGMAKDAIIQKAKWTLYMLPQVTLGFFLAGAITWAAGTTVTLPPSNRTEFVFEEWQVGLVAAGTVIFTSIIARTEELLTARVTGGQPVGFWSHSERMAVVAAVAWMRRAYRQMRALRPAPVVTQVALSSFSGEVMSDAPEQAPVDAVAAAGELRAAGEQQC